MISRKEARVRGGAKGVTLLELTVALTILAMIGGIAVVAARLGGQAWTRGEQRAEAEQRTRILVGNLARELASALPVTASVDEKSVVAFRGGPDWIYFHTEPTGHGPLPFSAMVRSLAYSVQPDRGLVVQESYPLVEGEVSRDPRAPEKVVDAEVTRVQFRYLESPQLADELPRWTDWWDGEKKTREAMGKMLGGILDESAVQTTTEPTRRKGSRPGGVSGAPSGIEGGLPLAVKVTVVRREQRAERTLSFVAPIRASQGLTAER